MLAILELGISPRRFNGWEPVTRTWTTGNKTVTRTEPEWDEVDQALVLAHMGNEELRCPGCGWYMDESMSTDYGWRVEEPVCHRCAAHEKHRTAHPKPRPGAMLVSTPVPIPKEDSVG